ncbi:hypothetical protein [Shewanella algae]
MKKLILMSALVSLPVIADYGDWVKTTEDRTFTTPDIVNGKVKAIIKTYKDGVLRFALPLSHDSCYVKESYSEPFGTMLVVGNYQNFRLQCIGKKEAVVFADDNSVNAEIINSLVNSGNVCLTINDNNESVKMCFSGKGVKEMQAEAAKQ